MGDPCGKHFLHTFGRIVPECRKLCVSLPYPRVLASYGKSIDANHFFLRMSEMNKEFTFPSLFVKKQQQKNISVCMTHREGHSHLLKISGEHRCAE